MFPFNDLYNCCKFWHTVGFTVLLTAGSPVSMDVGSAVASDAIVDVAVGTTDDSFSMAVDVAVTSLSLADNVSDADVSDADGPSVVASS